MENNQKVVTRFAPSPTGFLHIGGVRTALYSFLYARQNNGQFVLRIEDTDKERSREEWTQGLIDDLAWLGLNHDVFAKQSERTEIYKKYLQKLIDDGFAYISKETPKEEGQREEVIRFKNPNKKVKFTDLIRGEVEVDTTDLGNFVIARSIDEPIYHLAVVIDDFEMGITHVIRAEEHLSNTPRQILIQEAIGANRPIYAHLPLVLAEDRSKLSKRKHGETVSLTYYRNLGYIPQAILNFVALIGWNPGTDQEIFNLEELVKSFDISKVQKGGAIFNVEKLNWVNKEYIKKMSREDQKNALLSFVPDYAKTEMLDKILPVIIDKISIWSDVKKLFDAGEFDYFFKDPDYSKEKLLWKDEKDFENTKIHLSKVIEEIGKLPDNNFIIESIKGSIWDYATEKGRGNVLWPMRYALSGKDKSPDPFTLAEIFGKQETLRRLNLALEKINA
jgi:glutamyl-tRNA synthetase